MQSDAYFETIFKKRVGGIKPGLDRMRRAYELLGRPAASIPSILVGGTNGKGSTAGFLWGMLARSDLAVGLYSSPHLLHFIERYQMSHAATSDAELVELLEEMKQRLPRDAYEDLSFFEIATLLALCLFERHGCQMIILEVGLGGRWDATNVVEPILSILVSVSRDHEIYLGSDLGGIAFEKLAIGRRDRPMFWGCAGEILVDAKAMLRFSQLVDDYGLDLYVKGRDFLRMDEQQVELRIAGTSVLRGQLPSKLKLQPRFLQDNFLLALGAYHWLVEQANLPFKISPTENLLFRLEERGILRSMSMVARCQKFLIHSDCKARELLFDVCHNPDGARVLGQSLQALALRPPALVSILGDKDINGILDELRQVCDDLVLFAIDAERGMKSSQIAERHSDLVYFESFAKAWQHALNVWHNHKTPWLVCGSVLAVGQILHVFEIQPAKAALTTL